MARPYTWIGRPFAVVRTCPRCGDPVFRGVLWDGQTVTCDLSVAHSGDRAFVPIHHAGQTLIRLYDPSTDRDRPRFARHVCRDRASRAG